MNRIEFDKLDKLGQMEHVNNQLKESGLTLTKICERIGIGRSTVRDRFKSIGYFYNKDLNLYVVDCNSSNSNGCNVKNNNMYNTRNIDVEFENSNNDISIMSFDDFEFKENIIALAKDYQDIQQMLQDYRQNKIIVSKQIIIDYLSKVGDSETKLTTQRVNKNVLEKFNSFVEKNKQFTKVDLLSQALTDFMDSYE